jgi:hypothetical protein
MEVSDQLHASAALRPAKELTVPVGQETGWAQAQVAKKIHFPVPPAMERPLTSP